MTFAHELAELFRRDLTRLHQEIEAFADEPDLWRTTGGVTNSAGHLALHLEGNLREFVLRILGGETFQRDRPAEFNGEPKPKADLLSRVGRLIDRVPEVIGSLDAARLDAAYPARVLGPELTVRQFLIHLYGHLSYHTGQIDYLRRALTGEGAIDFAGL